MPLNVVALNVSEWHLEQVVELDAQLKSAQQREDNWMEEQRQVLLVG